MVLPITALSGSSGSSKNTVTTAVTLHVTDCKLWTNWMSWYLDLDFTQMLSAECYRRSLLISSFAHLHLQHSPSQNFLHCYCHLFNYYQHLCVCGRGVGSNSVQCASCHKWLHKKCSGIKGSMYKVMRSFICRGCSNPVISTGHISVGIGASANLEVVDKLVPLLTNRDISLISYHPPFPQIDIIGAVVIVWRVRGKIIRSVLCNIVCNNCAQCNAHTYEQT